MSASLAGKVAIVTGAANGIGLSIARRLRDGGALVMMADIDEDALEREAAEMAASEGPELRHFAGDLREKLTQANLLSATLDAFDRVDILVNASRQVMATDVLDPSDTSVETLLSQNLMTALRLSQLVARRMVQQASENGSETVQAGAIVNLSSIAASRTQAHMLAYSISCAALEQATRALAVALAPHAIRVNAVAFGSVMSASLKEALREDGEMRERIAQGTPLGRVGRARDVAEAVAYLACDDAGFVTGHVLTVDGGRTLIDPVSVCWH